VNSGCDSSLEVSSIEALIMVRVCQKLWIILALQ
jgi:hypothetical protein